LTKSGEALAVSSASKLLSSSLPVFPWHHPLKERNLRETRSGSVLIRSRSVALTGHLRPLTAEHNRRISTLALALSRESVEGDRCP
jgi:hypothetical protein